MQIGAHKIVSDRQSGPPCRIQAALIVECFIVLPWLTK